MSDSAFYLDRVTSGDYNRLIDNVRKMGSRALINLEYKRDFERDTRNGFKLKSNDEKIVPFTAWIFGEIRATCRRNTSPGFGNHYIGRPPHLHEDEQLEQENDQNVEAVEWLSPSNPDRAADLMCVYMGPKYVVPSSSTSTSSGTKRRGRKRKTTENHGISTYSGGRLNAHGACARFVTPSVSEIKLGAHYDPRLLSDYDGILTPPWLEYDKLRNGTVVLTRISKLLAEKVLSNLRGQSEVLMPSLEPIDERSIRLSIDDYTTNEEGIQSDSNNNCLRGFDTVSPARDSDRTAQSSSANHLKVIDSVSPLAPGKGMLG
ncbi:hypothetical protein F5887DRAFT_1070524 [Amanita rubescens]|nr:hypothetical protein F5887DRAFT_1070524 [Amanita rubescens]